MTLIIVTHDINVVKLADKVIKVLDGKILDSTDNSLLNDDIEIES